MVDWHSVWNTWFIYSLNVNHTVKVTSCDNGGKWEGGKRCRWLWGMESLNRSLMSPIEWRLINRLWGEKKSWHLQGDPQVRVSIHIRVSLCGCVVMGFPWKMHTWPVSVWPTVHTHTTCMHANRHLPVTSLSTSHPPLALPHTHKTQLNYPGVLLLGCRLSLLFLLREAPF